MWLKAVIVVNLTVFCNEAHLHRKGPILNQMYAYCLIEICANSTGAPRRYWIGSADRVEFHLMQLI